MFENMSKRERILATLLSSLVPLSLSFMAIFWFIQKYGDNNLQIIQLSGQISDEESKALLARKALKRLDFYQEVSLPKDFNNSSSQYQQWLLDLARKHGLKGYSVKPQPGQPIKFKNKEIAKSQLLKMTADAGLEEMTNFFHEFYSLGTHHRIKMLKILPETTMVKGSKVRTGRLSMVVDIEVAILSDAEKEFDFNVARHELNRTLDDYQKAIVNRNIFGPPNNMPLVKVSPSSSYASNTEIKITVRGEDADKDDALEFALLGSAIEGARLEPKSSAREATLVLPPTTQGTYEIKVGVKDSGFPPKESDSVFQVVLKDPPNSKPTITAKLSNPYPPDRPIEIVLEGVDRDVNDVLSFAILEGTPGAEISKENDADRNPILHIPALDIGVYPFKVSISDGRETEEDKIVERTFDVVVERTFSHFNETRITSILRETSGEWFVNVRIRTMGRSHYLGLGDSFELEGKTWTVRDIKPNQVIFQDGDQLLTLEPRVPFSTPIRSETLATDSTADDPISLSELKPTTIEKGRQ